MSYTSKTKSVLDVVTSRKQAEEVVTKLLEVYSTSTAFDRVASEAVALKQSTREVVKRRVSNLFNSFTPYRGWQIYCVGYTK